MPARRAAKTSAFRKSGRSLLPLRARVLHQPRQRPPRRAELPARRTPAGLWQSLNSRIFRRWKTSGKASPSVVPGQSPHGPMSACLARPPWCAGGPPTPARAGRRSGVARHCRRRSRCRSGQCGRPAGLAAGRPWPSDSHGPGTCRSATAHSARTPWPRPPHGSARHPPRRCRQSGPGSSGRTGTADTVPVAPGRGDRMDVRLLPGRDQLRGSRRRAELPARRCARRGMTLVELPQPQALRRGVVFPVGVRDQGNHVVLGRVI